LPTALIRLYIDCETITGRGQQGRAGRTIVTPQETQAVVQGVTTAPLPSNQSLASEIPVVTVTPQEPQTVMLQGTTDVPITSNQRQAVTGGFGGENARNGGFPSGSQVLNYIALKYFQTVDPSNPEELNRFLRYIKDVLKNGIFRF